MKISKTTKADSSIKACRSKYKDPVDKIYAAIQCLGTLAKEDVLAREAIADLSVVMLDLKSTN